ncbi:phosphatidate cytidylyltransferase [Bifidobacterium sp. SMB2]|uniref:Phosphatidate cytidylyltransferase n=1 Tax=Bifidobacterium saimiriisciurei TaxID=2661627 RepID=A0ABX0CB02_9BIFI|nr:MULTISPECIES: phosphatidate cytidylyltransferase [Bifidobacterium]NEG96809.1 phosphatidate cytidylyltransferase [Bifidobacterium sp. SMB2]NEH12278.1 phosphatidate cytidylyltransferase [Bifidobacterium saimiriisciurei]
MSRSKRKEEAEEAIDSINKRTGRNMPQAIGTGVVLVAIILAALMINIDVFVGLIVVFMVLALWELRVDFATVGIRIPVLALWVSSTIILIATYAIEDHVLAMCIGTALALPYVALAASTRLSVVGRRVSMAVANKLSHADADMREKSSFNMQDDGRHVPRFTNVAVSLFVVLYVPFLAGFIVLPLTWEHPVAHAFLMVFVPALGDIGGLVFGAWMGRHKLSPRISPKKSVEGLLGSILFCFVGALVIFLVTYDRTMWVSHWWVPVLFGVMIGIVGTFGDLCASMLKRDLGIKDMGHLLKGHGGVLDRVDSILMAAPFICAVLAMVGL